MTNIRQSDPAKRAELHAARAILMGVDSLLTSARIQADAGGAAAVARRINKAREELHRAVLDLVEKLRVN